MRLLTIGAMQQQGILNFEPETLAYQTRVLADGGEIMDIGRTDKVVKALKYMGLWGNISKCHLGYGGMKLRIDGTDQRIAACYCLNNFDLLNADNDATQPILSGDEMVFSGGQHILTDRGAYIDGTLLLSMKSTTKTRQGIGGGYLDESSVMIATTTGFFHYGRTVDQRSEVAELIADGNKKILGIKAEAITTAEAMYIDGVSKALAVPSGGYRVSNRIILGASFVASPSLWYTGVINFALALNTRITDAQVLELTNRMNAI